MTNEQALNLFMKATSSSICGTGDCYHCHEIYKTDSCPSKILVSKEEICKFVKKVSKLLREWDDDMPFATEITDDEIVALLESAATVD